MTTKMTKAKARRMCIEIMKKAEKLEKWGRLDGRLKHGIGPSFYTKMLRISEDAFACHQKIR